MEDAFKINTIRAGWSPIHNFEQLQQGIQNVESCIGIRNIDILRKRSLNTKTHQSEPYHPLLQYLDIIKSQVKMSKNITDVNMMAYVMYYADIMSHVLNTDGFNAQFQARFIHEFSNVLFECECAGLAALAGCKVEFIESGKNLKIKTHLSHQKFS